jgi:hypothetical protein
VRTRQRRRRLAIGGRRRNPGIEREVIAREKWGFGASVEEVVRFFTLSTIGRGTSYMTDGAQNNILSTGFIIVQPYIYIYI